MLPSIYQKLNCCDYREFNSLLLLYTNSYIFRKEKKEGRFCWVFLLKELQQAVTVSKIQLLKDEGVWLLCVFQILPCAAHQSL